MSDGGGLVLSVVSHGQRNLLLSLFDDLRSNVGTPFRVILTENIPERPSFPVADYPFPIEVIRNRSIKGFGANHNSALERSGNGLFCIVNPDIRMSSDPFPMLTLVVANPRVGVVAPTVRAHDLSIEDHARPFPNIFTLIGKAFGHRPRVAQPPGLVEYRVDWVAGMFMLFRSDTLRSVDGFDEKFFLYYEDVDLCARIGDRGFEVVVCTAATVIHSARRESRRNLRYAWWHMRSAARFLGSRPRVALGLPPRPEASAQR